MGTRIGTNAGKSSARDTTFGFTWPVTVTVDAASVSPKNMAPESPMKMRAGWKLWGKKPRQQPTRAATTSEAREEKSPGEASRGRRQEQMQNAEPPSIAMPAASPA